VIKVQENCVVNPHESWQCYLKQTFKGIRKLEQQSVDVTIQWIPGHQGVSDNETTDKAARKAIASSGLWLQRQPNSYIRV
jgi:ribonuclease HI